MRALGLFLGLTFLLAPGRQVSAATITVDDLTDSSGGLTCTLRNAITAANTNAATGSCPAGDPGADTIAFSVKGTITPASDLPPIAEDLTIEGPGADRLTIDGAHKVVGVVVSSGVTATLEGLTIANAETGIENFGTLTVSNGTLSGNQLRGGILNHGTLTVNNTTLSGNSSFACAGGGISSEGVAAIVNSTFGGNEAFGFLCGYGRSGINNSGTMTVTNCTIAGNGVDVVPGVYNVGTLTIANSIIANNSGGNCGGTAVNGGADNLSDDATCTGFAVGDPMLGPLHVNPPGTTATFALLPGSAAIDTGNDATCTATDQRGVTRPQGAHCDIGSFEYTRCGNGIAEPGEDCDDGVALNGTFASCCSASCTVAISTGCLEPALPHASSIWVMANGTPTKNALSWGLRAQATALGDFGDPTSTTNYAICVYDETAGMKVKLRADAPAGSGWTRNGTKGFVYASKALTPNGLKVVRLVAGASGKAQVRVRGEGANLAAQQPPYSPKVTVQLKASNGKCWDATYGTPTTNVAGRFRTKSP